MAVALTCVTPTTKTHSGPTLDNSSKPPPASLNLVILTDNGRVYLAEGYPSTGERYAWRWCVLGTGLDTTSVQTTGGNADIGEYSIIECSVKGVDYHYVFTLECVLAPIVLGVWDGSNTQPASKAVPSTRKPKGSALSHPSQGKQEKRTALAHAAAGSRGSDPDQVIGGGYCLRSCSVEGECTLFAVTGIDGAIRLYDWNALVYQYAHHRGTVGYTDYNAGPQRRWLTSRPPHGKVVSAVFLHKQGLGGGSAGGASSSVKSQSSQAAEGRTLSLSFHAVIHSPIYPLTYYSYICH